MTIKPFDVQTIPSNYLYIVVVQVSWFARTLFRQSFQTNTKNSSLCAVAVAEACGDRISSVCVRVPLLAIHINTTTITSSIQTQRPWKKNEIEKYLLNWTANIPASIALFFLSFFLSRSGSLALLLSLSLSVFCSLTLEFIFSFFFYLSTFLQLWRSTDWK